MTQNDDAWYADLIAAEQACEATQLSEIKARLADDPYTATAYAVSCGLADEVPPLLFDLWSEGQITDEQLPNALSAVWVRNRSPLRSLGERKWLALFKAVGFFIVNSSGGRVIHIDGRATPIPTAFAHRDAQPVAPVEVWRGCPTSTNGRGMSWTIHRECAEGFAEGVVTFGVEAGIYRATIPPRAVLALFGDDREQEVVVNPNTLRGRIQLHEIIPGRPLLRWPHATGPTGNTS
jgi:hypothetical protein